MRGGAQSIAVILAGAAAAYASRAGLARLLGTEEFGSYAYVLVWITTLALVGRCGMDLASVRFLSSYLANGSWGLFGGFIRFSLATVMIGSCGVVVLVGVVLAGTGRLDSASLTLVSLGAALIVVLAFQETTAAQLRALKKIISSELPRYVFLPVGVLMAVGLVALWGQVELDATSALGVTVLVHIAAVVFFALRLLVSAPAKARAAAPEWRHRTWMRASLALLAVAGLQLINTRTDVLMLGAIRSVGEVGVYVATTQTASLTSLGLTGFGVIAAPVASGLFAAGKLDRLQSSMTAAARGIAVYTVPVALCLLLFGRQLLSLFGPDFPIGYSALVILVGGQVVSALAGPVGWLAIMTDHHSATVRILGAGALLNVALNAWLIPSFGLVGAASATTAARIVCNVGLLILITRKLDLNPTIFKLGARR